MVIAFFVDGIRYGLKGNSLFWIWILGLTTVALLGVNSYMGQLENGLIVTGMSDQVSWGIYISNFTYLVGVAAAAVMLVIPAYVFSRDDIQHVVLIGEGVAVAAVTMAMLFVIADLGQPIRMWHMLPVIGRFNLPQSLLAWDVLVLSGYLFLNITIPMYMLYQRYQGKEPDWRIYFPGVMLSIFWAISIHTVTAFLFSSNIARPFWHTAVLGPRFLASAFCSGPALIILALQILERLTLLKVRQSIYDSLAVITTTALQITLFLIGVEFFTEFYASTEHTLSAQFLFFGLGGNNTLVPWIWTSIGLNTIAVVILTLHPLRRQRKLLNIALPMLIVGVWIDKGMGLIIPGFIPTTMGEVFQYEPTATEIQVSLGITAVGLLIFTLAAKIGIAIEMGVVNSAGREQGLTHR